MRSVVLILCTYFWIYLRPPPDAQILHLLGGPVSLLGGGRAPPGVWVIPTLSIMHVMHTQNTCFSAENVPLFGGVGIECGQSARLS